MLKAFIEKRIIIAARAMRQGQPRVTITIDCYLPNDERAVGLFPYLIDVHPKPVANLKSR